MICPKFTQCPDGTVEIYSTSGTPVEEQHVSNGISQELAQAEENIPEDSLENKDSKKTPALSKDSQGKRSVDYDEISPQQHLEYTLNSASNETETVTRSTLDYDNSTLIHQCCTQLNCVCDTNLCPSPKCEEGLVARVINHDVGHPDNCCPVFQCEQLPICGEDDKGLISWRENCRSCNCYKNQTDCKPTQCLATRNETVLEQVNVEHRELDLTHSQGIHSCFTINRHDPYLNGAQWNEGDCTNCTCLNGNIKCQSSWCKAVTCPTSVKRPGECCDICEGFCEGHEYCDQHCISYVNDTALNCMRCECNPRESTTTTTVTMSPGKVWVRDETSTPSSISGIAAPTPSTPSNNASQPTPEPKPSVQINIINNNYHNSTTVAEQDEIGNQGKIIVGVITFLIGLFIGILAGFLYMRSRQKKQGSYSTVPPCETSEHQMAYKNV